MDLHAIFQEAREGNTMFYFLKLILAASATHSEFVSFFRYTAENSVEYDAPRNTDHPELRQPLVLEIWDSLQQSLHSGSKITILTNGPLTSLAKIILMRQNTTALIQVNCRPHFMTIFISLLVFETHPY